MCASDEMQRAERSGLWDGARSCFLLFSFLYFDYAIYLRVFATKRKQESGSEFQDGRWGGYGERESERCDSGKGQKWARQRQRREICSLYCRFERGNMKQKKSSC